MGSEEAHFCNACDRECSPRLAIMRRMTAGSAMGIGVPDECRDCEFALEAEKAAVEAEDVVAKTSAKKPARRKTDPNRSAVAKKKPARQGPSPKSLKPRAKGERLRPARTVDSRAFGKTVKWLRLYLKNNNKAINWASLHRFQKKYEAQVGVPTSLPALKAELKSQGFKITRKHGVEAVVLENKAA